MCPVSRKRLVGCVLLCARFWTNRLQPGMGSGCTKGPLGLTTLTSRKGSAGRAVLGAGRAVLGAGRADPLLCGADVQIPRSRLHQGRVAALYREAAASGNTEKRTLPPALPPPSPCVLSLPHPLRTSPARGQSLLSPVLGGREAGRGLRRGTELGEVRWACFCGCK